MTNLFAEHKDRIIQLYNTATDGLPKVNTTKSNKTILIDINNIAEFEFGNSEPTEAPMEYIKLPWDNCWFEYLVPARKMFQAARRLYSMEDGSKLTKELDGTYKGKINIGVFAQQIGKIIVFYVIERMDKNSEPLPIGLWVFDMERNKESIFIDKRNPKYQYMSENYNESIARNSAHDTVQIYIWPAIVSILFSNCRNITYYDAKPPEELVKKAEKNGKTPQEIYKILDINRSSKYAKSEKEYESDGSKRRLHVCRGHFREYTEDAPLFGNYVGMVWIPMHTRGSEKIGKVHKDYNLVTN